LIARSTENAPRTLNPPDQDRQQCRHATEDDQRKEREQRKRDQLRDRERARRQAARLLTRDGRPAEHHRLVPGDRVLQVHYDIAVACPRAQRRGDKHVPAVA
jgi:hypothetical protein